MSMYPASALGPPTYRPYDDYSRPLDEYRAAMDFPVSGHHPPPVPGSWATTPTSLTQPSTDERHHEDTKSGVLWSGTDKGGGGVGGVGAGAQSVEAQWRAAAELQLSMHAMSMHHEPMHPFWNTMDGKMQMENPDMGSYGRPQSSTSLSPPVSGLVVPQPLNARLPQNMLGMNGGGHRKYQCKMCPQAFASKADLQLHTQIHLREPKPYKCASCGKAFANSSYLSQHTRIHLGIKPYRCEICQRKFTQLSHLQQHIRTHTGDKPYKCRIPGCTKAFSQLSNLQSHSRCHQTDKPYKCNSCYKCFTDEPALLEHIPKHKESKHVKTHICAYCGKSYTQETYLAKHMQKHSDRLDKRAPILGGPPNGMVPGPEYNWPKLDPMAMYSSYQQPLMDHSRLAELDGRDHGYSSVWDPRNSSAFTPLQPTATNTSVENNKPSPYDSFKTNGQDMKSGVAGSGLNISLSQIRNYSSDKPLGENIKQDQ